MRIVQLKLSVDSQMSDADSGAHEFLNGLCTTPEGEAPAAARPKAWALKGPQRFLRPAHAKWKGKGAGSRKRAGA